jgi:hypothetical protein
VCVLGSPTLLILILKIYVVQTVYVLNYLFY